MHSPRADAVSVSASSSENPASFPPANAADGNPATRWSSAHSDDQWLIIDYGAERDLVGLSLHWEAANAQKFAVELSNDGKKWRRVYKQDAARGGVEDIYFGRQRGRYVKLKFLQRATSWGYSLWEIVPRGLGEEIVLTSSSAARGEDAARVLDGDPATAWKPASNGAAWVAMSFPEDRIIAGVDVGGIDRPEEAWHLELSRDGTNWVRVGEWRREADRSSCLIGKAAVRHVRLVRESGSSTLGEVGVLSWENIAAGSSLEIIRGLAGIEGSETKVHVGRDGSFVAEPHDGQVGFAVYDRDADILYTPETMVTDWSLEDGRLPFNEIRWRAAGLAAQTTIFAESHDSNELTYARTVLSNTTDRARRVTALVTVRPSSVNAERAKALRSVSRPLDQQLRMNEGGIIQVQWPEGENTEAGDKLSPLGVRVLGVDTATSVEPAVKYFAAGRDIELQPGGVANVTVWVPSRMPLGADFAYPDADARHDALRKEWQGRVPMVLKVPDKRYEDYFYASAYYLLLLSTTNEIWPGPVNYRTFFLHDSVEMVEALDKVGLGNETLPKLQRFRYNLTDNYLDGLGGLAYGLYIHYALTKDHAYLQDVYPKILASCETIRKLRHDHLPETTNNPALTGLMPPSASQDNFNKHAHLYQDNWWSCVGLRAGALAAEAVGRPEDAAWINRECDSLVDASMKSIRAVMKREKVDYIPAFADAWPHEERIVDADHRILGEAQMASAHRPLWSPGLSLGLKVPPELFAKSYAAYWKRAGAFSGFDGAWFVEYEKVFWGYNLQLARPLPFLGLNDIALLNLKWCVDNPSCPGAWMEAMKSRLNREGRYELAPGIIGDVPHGWVASHYILLLRDMLAREEGDKLHVLACVPPEWFTEGKSIELSHAPTMFGLLDLTAKRTGKVLRVTFQAEQPPPGGWVVTLPEPKKIAKIQVDGEDYAGMTLGDLQLPSAARVIEVVYR